MDKHRLLREMYKNFHAIEAHVAGGGSNVIQRGEVDVSFYDLKRGLDLLSPRRRQAFELTVIDGLRQREAAAIMGIAAGSIGQHANLALDRLVDYYFADAA